jgi:hypothetical protein
MSQSVQTKETLCPIVRSERLDVARIVDVSGTGIRKIVRFEADIDWLRESESSLVVLDGEGRILERVITQNDWYGLLTSIDDRMIAAIPRMAARYGVLGPEATLGVAIVTNLVDSPMLRSTGTSTFHPRKRLSSTPKDWIIDEDDVIEKWRASAKANRGLANPEIAPKFLDPRVIRDEIVITTRRPGSTAAIDALVADAIEGLDENERQAVIERAEKLKKASLAE